MLRSTYAVIHLDAIVHNVSFIKKRLPEKTGLLAVIKANAYGHGLCEVGSNLDRNPAVAMFGVAICEEGVRLREAGVKKPILILGVTDPEHFDAVVKYDLIPAVFTKEHVFLASKAAISQNKNVSVHVKIDSGMHRIGVPSLDALSELLDAFDESPNVLMHGVFTHFAKSENDPDFTAMQAERFEKAVSLIHQRGYNPVVHAANSAAILSGSRYYYDMVRLGISMYGYYPDGKRAKDDSLLPAMSFITHVSNLQMLPAGEGVSYGQRYLTTHPTVVATLPVGYGDGYKRCLSGKADVLIGGLRCPQIGTICMDQIMVDVSHVPSVHLGDEAVLIGPQGSENITADELAERANTISYEILLSVSDRVPRIYN